MKKSDPRRRNTKKGTEQEPLTRRLKLFYGPAGARRDSLIRRDEAFWNLAAYEKEWKKYPEYCDFLDPKSPIHRQKAFEKEVYLNHMQPYIDRLPEGGKVLDAGGGTGRFAVEIARRGFDVSLVDVSRRALSAARRHLKKAGIDNVEFFLAESEQLGFFPAGTAAAALAIELICYSPRPEKILESLHRALEPGGLLLFSVENLHGALLGDGRLEPDDVAEALAKGEVRVPGYLYVKYYSKKELRELLVGNGFKLLSIRGCQYTSSGPFDSLARRALREGKPETLHGVERLCASDPLLRRLPRAWFAAAEKV
ncbi:MAG: methyltransferase domain-containing protein [bacterium]